MPAVNSDAATLSSLLAEVAAEKDHFSAGTDTYYFGKSVQRLGNLISIAQSLGNTTTATAFLQAMEVQLVQVF
jgi:hypothetical protein